MRRVQWALGSIAVALLFATTSAPLAFADGPNFGRLVVPGDHVEPGDDMSILGSQITGRQVSLRLASGAESADLGQAPVASDGTFQARATVPHSFPLGYAELTATDEQGNATSTTILIGARAEGPRPASAAMLDERAVGVAVLCMGVIIFSLAGARYLRGRSRDSTSPD